MRNTEDCFPEVTTSDIGRALYFLSRGCKLTKVEYTEDEYYTNPRFTMTFTGMNIRIHNQAYFAGAGRPDFSLLNDLLNEINNFVVLYPGVCL